MPGFLPEQKLSEFYYREVVKGFPLVALVLLLALTGCVCPFTETIRVPVRPAATPGPTASLESDRVGDLNDDPAVHIERGLTYLSQGQFEWAIAEYDKAIELDPNLAEAYVRRAFVYKVLGQYEQAMADYDKAIELSPNNAMFYNDRGFAYAEQEQYESAIRDYNKAIELSPDHPNIDYAYNNRGFAYGNLEKYDQALHDFERAITLNRDNAWIFYNRALIYLKMGKNAMAITDLELSLQLENPPLDGQRRARAEELVKQLLTEGRES
jgi:type IV pilus biogenesis/stability protein PilW